MSNLHLQPVRPTDGPKFWEDAFSSYTNASVSVTATERDMQTHLKAVEHLEGTEWPRPTRADEPVSVQVVRSIQHGWHIVVDGRLYKKDLTLTTVDSDDFVDYNVASPVVATCTLPPPAPLFAALEENMRPRRLAVTCRIERDAKWPKEVILHVVQTVKSDDVRGAVSKSFEDQKVIKTKKINPHAPDDVVASTLVLPYPFTATPAPTLAIVSHVETNRIENLRKHTDSVKSRRDLWNAASQPRPSQASRLGRSLRQLYTIAGKNPEDINVPKVHVIGGGQSSAPRELCNALVDIADAWDDFVQWANSGNDVWFVNTAEPLDSKASVGVRLHYIRQILVERGAQNALLIWDVLQDKSNTSFVTSIKQASGLQSAVANVASGSSTTDPTKADEAKTLNYELIDERLQIEQRKTTTLSVDYVVEVVEITGDTHRIRLRSEEAHAHAAFALFSGVLEDEAALRRAADRVRKVLENIGKASLEYTTRLPPKVTFYFEDFKIDSYEAFQSVYDAVFELWTADKDLGSLERMLTYIVQISTGTYEQWPPRALQPRPVDVDKTDALVVRRLPQIASVVKASFKENQVYRLERVEKTYKESLWQPVFGESSTRLQNVGDVSRAFFSEAVTVRRLLEFGQIRVRGIADLLFGTWAQSFTAGYTVQLLTGLASIKLLMDTHRKYKKLRSARAQSEQQTARALSLCRGDAVQETFAWADAAVRTMEGKSRMQQFHDMRVGTRRFTFTQLYTHVSTSWTTYRRLLTDKDWDDVVPLAIVAFQPPVDVCEKILESTSTRRGGVSEAIGMAVGRAAANAHETDVEVAAHAAHAAVLADVVQQRGGSNVLPEHLFESVVQQAQTVATRACAIVEAAYADESQDVRVDGDDVLWSCLHAGVAARIAMEQLVHFGLRETVRKKNKDIIRRQREVVASLPQFQRRARAFDEYSRAVERWGHAWQPSTVRPIRFRVMVEKVLTLQRLVQASKAYEDSWQAFENTEEAALLLQLQNKFDDDMVTFHRRSGSNRTRLFCKSWLRAASETSDVGSARLLYESTEKTRAAAKRSFARIRAMCPRVSFASVASDSFAYQDRWEPADRSVLVEQTAAFWAASRVDPAAVATIRDVASVEELVVKMKRVTSPREHVAHYYCPVSQIVGLPLTRLPLGSATTMPVVWLTVVVEALERVAKALSPVESVDVDASVVRVVTSECGSSVDTCTALEVHPLVLTRTQRAVTVPLSRTHASIATIATENTTAFDPRGARAVAVKAHTLYFNADRFKTAVSLAVYTSEPEFDHGATPVVVECSRRIDALALAIGLTMMNEQLLRPLIVETSHNVEELAVFLRSYTNDLQAAITNGCKAAYANELCYALSL